MKIRMSAIIIFYISIFCALALYVQECRGDENCKYNVSEIDALRVSLENRYMWGSSCFQRIHSKWSRSYKDDERSAIVEYQLRTYMQACIKARDIISEDCREE